MRALHICLLSLSLAQPAFSDEVTVTKAPDLPEKNVVVNNTEEATEFEPVQARWRNWSEKETAGPGETDKRGVSQVFNWPSSQALKTLGLKADAFEHPLNLGVVAPQGWHLDIQHLDEEGKVLETVASFSLEIKPGDCQRGEFLIFNFSPAVNLLEGGKYGVHLRPGQIVDGQRIYFSRTALGPNQKLGGGASQTLGNKLNRYHRQQEEGQRFDLIFFLSHE